MMKKLLLIVGLFFAGISAASAQCSGQSPSGYVCGNPGASQGVPSFNTITSMLDRALGSTQGLTLNRGASNWSATAALVLGLNGGTGGSVVLNGSTSGSATIQVPAAAGTNTLFQLPNTNGTNNQVLTTDGSGHLTWTSLTGTGTVTSVGLSMPAIFTVTGSPVTTSGTLTATLANETANTVWAGPSTGAAAAPTFRSLVGADLPAPTFITLGGIQANSPVLHEWINSINVSGVPQLSQPAFSDISGSISPTQCPASGLATLGCVNAINATSSQWLRSLSTSGVFSSSQPNFTDLAGNATLSQLPGIGNNTVLANNSGGTSTPLALTASNVLDMIGSTQGQILYRNATNWTVLSPGTNGQVLTTAGAAANPSWTTVSGTGTVTNISAGIGIALSPSPITTTGSVALAAINNGTVLANISGSSAAPTGTTPSGVLDVIGSTQGSLLTRGASTWGALTPGTSGQFLQTSGAGSTPAWANAVTSVSSGTGLTGGPITTTGTLSLSPPIFAGYQSANQSVTDSTFTIANINTVVVDSNSWFNTTTHLYTPLVAGTYLVTGKVRCTSSPSNVATIADISKSGTDYARGSASQPAAGTLGDANISVALKMNGTTDTIGLLGFCQAGTPSPSSQITGGTAPEFTYMHIQYIGP